MNSKQERQNLILSCIKNNKKISSFDILSFLSDSVNKRTLQRDLKELLDNNLISQGGRSRGIYYFIDVKNNIFENIDIDKYFAINYQDRIVQEKFNFDIFNLLKGEIWTNKERQELDNLQQQFIKNISKYDSQTLINKEYERIMIEFSWKSSMIEGNTYSLLNTEALLKENIKDKTKTNEEAQMILNHKDAFNESIINYEKFMVLKKSSIEYLHSILIKKLGITKNIRTNPVGITGTKYKPLDNEFQIQEALEKTVELVNLKDDFFEKSFIVLIMISYIQAFEDGNKRSARTFSNAILLANNSVPLSYRIVDVVEYKKASILFYEINNISYFKQIFIEQFKDSVNNYFN
jgi:Fic family protein